jgi:hypothetical protein
MAWHAGLRGATSVRAKVGVAVVVFGGRRGARAWQDSCREPRLEGSGVTFDKLIKPADDGELLH